MSKQNKWFRMATILVAASFFIAALPSRSAGAQPTTLNIQPAADAYVISSSPDANAGTAASLWVDKNPAARSYLKFNVSGVGTSTITSAVLRLYANSDNSAGIKVYAVADTSWSETSITYANAPGLGDELKSSGSVSAGAWLAVDISGYVKGDGTYSLSLAGSTGKKTDFAAREDAAHAPQLVLTITAPTAPAQPTTAAPTATAKPTTGPTALPTAGPTTQPTNGPTTQPTVGPTLQPTIGVTSQPAVSINSATYYVSTSGSDSNPGTATSPWRTIQKAANTLVAGQTVKILPGTYYAKFAPVNSGTASAYIIYTADPGTVILDGSGVSLSTDYKGDGLVQIQGKSYIKVQNLMLRNASVFCANVSENASGMRSSYIELTGLNIQNCTKKGIQVRYSDHFLIKDNVINHILYSSGIGVWWSSYATVDHNTITNAHYYHECQGAYDEALTLSGVNHFEVKNNTLDNTEANPAGFCSGSEKLGIDTKESSQNGLVYGNSVKHMNAGGIYVDGWHAGANGTPTLNHINIFQNRVSDGGGIVVGCEQSDGIVEYINIYNNLVVNAYFSGIQVRGAYGNGLRKNINIDNNTIYGAATAGGNGGAGIYVTTANLASNNGDAPVMIRNNISMFYFLSTGGGTVGQIRAGTSTMASKVHAEHNLVYGPQACSQEYPYCVELGTRISASAVNVFTNPGGFDLHLKLGSPTINSGLNLSLVSTDLDGVARPQGTAYDIGTYEYH